MIDAVKRIGNPSAWLPSLVPVAGLIIAILIPIFLYEGYIAKKELAAARAELSEQESTIAELTVENRQLDGALGEAMTDLHDAQNQIAALSQDKRSLNGSKAYLQDKVTVLREKVTQAEQQAVLSSSPEGKTMMVKATAYTAYCKGCSGITKTGINLRANPNAKVIAVDPTVIPLGTKVYVEGYGEAVAGDIGGGIKGQHIDLFMQHRDDALEWGVRQVRIRILN